MLENVLEQFYPTEPDPTFYHPWNMERRHRVSLSYDVRETPRGDKHADPFTLGVPDGIATYTELLRDFVHNAPPTATLSILVFVTFVKHNQHCTTTGALTVPANSRTLTTHTVGLAIRKDGAYFVDFLTPRETAVMDWTEHAVVEIFTAQWHLLHDVNIDLFFDCTVEPCQPLNNKAAQRARTNDVRMCAPLVIAYLLAFALGHRIDDFAYTLDHTSAAHPHDSLAGRLHKRVTYFAKHVISRFAFRLTLLFSTSPPSSTGAGAATPTPPSAGTKTPSAAAAAAAAAVHTYRGIPRYSQT